MNDIERIENLLRKAPPLNPPSGLHEKLQRQIPLADRDAIKGVGQTSGERGLQSASTSERVGLVQTNPGTVFPLSAKQAEACAPVRSVFKRWWPVLAFSVLFLASLVAIAVQSNLLSELRRENTRLRASNQDVQQLRKATAEYQSSTVDDGKGEVSGGNSETERLREEMNKLRAQLRDLQPLRAENQRLRAEIKAAENQLPPDAQREEDPFQAAREKAQRVACINNIKQIALGARLWANDNDGAFPMDFASMSNELVRTKLLVCPGDTNRSVTPNWHEVTPANITYELLSPRAPENDPAVVFVRCPIHNNVGLIDGSAHMLNKNRSVVQKDGKWVIGGGN